MPLTNFKADLTSYLKKLAGVHAVGELWWHYDPKSKPAGVQLFSGQLLSREAYTDHWALVSIKRTVVTEEEWQAQVTSHGFCQWYSSGDGSTTYRMPLIKDVHPKFVAALAEAGQYLEAGLPQVHLTNATAITLQGGEVKSAKTSLLEASGSGCGAYFNSSSNGNTGGVGMDVSNHGYATAPSALIAQNPIYGNSDTVQPPSVTCVLGEYVVGSVAVIGEADAESLLAGQTLLEGKVGALENGVGRASAYITETWSSGTSWYRKWSDGWIEQGGNNLGVNSVNASVITFHVPFTDKPKSLLAVSGGGNYGGSWLAGVRYGTITTTGFTYLGPGNGTVPENGISWYACGY